MENFVEQFNQAVKERVKEHIDLRKYEVQAQIANQLRTNKIWTEIHMRISSEELKSHLKERAVFHMKKADYYVKQSQQMQSDDNPSFSNYAATGNPVTELDRLAKEHADSSARFAVMSKFLKEGTYELGVADMTSLQLDKSNG